MSGARWQRSSAPRNGEPIAPSLCGAVHTREKAWQENHAYALADPPVIVHPGENPRRTIPATRNKDGSIHRRVPGPTFGACCNPSPAAQLEVSIGERGSIHPDRCSLRVPRNHHAPEAHVASRERSPHHQRAVFLRAYRSGLQNQSEELFLYLPQYVHRPE